MIVDVEKAKVELVRLLKNNRFLKRDIILNAMKEKFPEITDRDIRKIKKFINLDRKHKTIVGSDTKKGYYIIKNEKDLKDTIERIEEQAYDLLQEKQILKEKFYLKKQMKLEVEKWETNTKPSLKIYSIE